jgi:hypothetical protein
MDAACLRDRLAGDQMVDEIAHRVRSVLRDEAFIRVGLRPGDEKISSRLDAATDVGKRFVGARKVFEHIDASDEVKIIRRQLVGLEIALDFGLDTLVVIELLDIDVDAHDSIFERQSNVGRGAATCFENCNGLGQRWVVRNDLNCLRDDIRISHVS